MTACFARLPPALLLLSLAAGCSSESLGTVSGRVIVDGKPLGGFEVMFTSEENGSVAIGYAKADGGYRLIRGRGHEHIPVGRYRVTVTPNEFVEGVPKPNVRLPGIYTDLSQSALIKSIEKGPNVIDLDLETTKQARD